MDILNQLVQGFITAGTPINLLWCLLGCTLGTAVGVLPGIGPATAVAMLLPITLKVEPTASMIFFAGIYYGAMYGGSTTSILLNTPGEAGSMVTALEGNKMAKQRPRRGGAGDGGDRLVRRRHDRHRARHVLRAGGRRLCHPARAARVLPADGAGVLHRQRGARQEHAARADGAVRRPGDGAGRHRPDHRPGALHGRRARADGRARGRADRGRPVRRRRGALRRALRGPHCRDAEQAEQGAHDRARNGAARGRPGCARPRSAFRSAAFRPAAARSRPS